MAGGGVRAIRYALEAGPAEVVANDRSGEACEGVLVCVLCRPVSLS